MRLALILLFSRLLLAQTNSAILALAGLELAAPGTRAQSQAPAFEVASVKVVDDVDNRDFLYGRRRSGGRITWTTNRLGLLLYAYSLQTFQISGIEPENFYYAIQAETEVSASDEQVRLMMQRLLDQRFHLTVHRETKKRQVLSLVVARGGPKIKDLKPESKASPPPGFLKGKSLGEGRMVSLMEGHPVLLGRRVTMRQLAEAIQNEVRTFVLDKTGLPGNFDIDLAYESEDSLGKAETDFPTIYGALQDQLGLKLERQTAPVEILVVDHMEKKPTEN